MTSIRHGLFITMLLCTAAVLPVQAAPDLGTRLLDAAHQDDMADVKALLGAKAPVNATQGDGATALAWAAANSDLDMVKVLLAAGADPNKANDYGVTPLSLAAQNGYTSIAEAVLGANAKPDLPLWTGETPLMFAARIGDTAVMKALIEHGAKVDIRETRYGQTALMWAAYAGKTDAVRLLIADKADVDMETPRDDVKIVAPGAPNGFSTLLGGKKGGLTALMFAASSPSSNNDIVDALIAAGASVNRQAADGTTPLLFATFRHVNQTFVFPHNFEVVTDPGMVQDLVKNHGANPNIADNNGITPLTGAVFSAVGGDFTMSGKKIPHDAEAEATVKILLAAGADPNAAIKFYATPVTQGQDVRYPVTYANVSPFMLAAALGKQKLADMLMASGKMNLNKTREGGNTPLMDSIVLASPIAFNALIRAGADVNAVNSVNGKTALHLAAVGAAGTGMMVKSLVDHGAKLDIKDHDGKTPADLAKQGGDGCAPGEPCRIGSGTVVDALLDIKGGRPVAPQNDIIVQPKPTEPMVVTNIQSGAKGLPGKDVMLAIATGKPIPAEGPAKGAKSTNPENPDEIAPPPPAAPVVASASTK